MSDAADECRYWQAEAAKAIGKAIGVLQQARPMEDPAGSQTLLLAALKDLSAAGGSLAAYAVSGARLLQERIDATREAKPAKMVEGPK